MGSNEALGAAAEKLWKSPTDKGWEAFRKVLLASSAKYYRTVYANGKIKSLNDLPKSYCELFDAKYNVITTVPVYKKGAEGIEGALWYLRGMLNSNLPKKKSKGRSA